METAYQLFVLVTTENWPDVALIAIQKNYLNFIIFMLFILIGVFFLSSVFLAVVFENYKRRVEQAREKKLGNRT